MLSILLLALVPGGHGETPAPRATLLPSVPLPIPNHGPGTTGGGSSTTSGETLRKGAFSVSLSTEITTYDDVSAEEAEAIATRIGEFDSIERTLVENVAVAYGLTDDVELGLQVGFYQGTNFIDAEFDGTTAESASADPEGLTDTWLTGKFRVMRGASGHLSVLAGLKLPTGDDDDTLSNFEPLEPSSQAGSGAVDYRLGLAYSRYLTPRVTLDASGGYTRRGTHDGFTVGDRAEAGTALAYRLTEDVQAPCNWSVFGELTAVWLGEDEADGETNENSGGTVVFLSAGLRNRVNRHLAISLAPAVPILQDVNGEQVEVDARLAFALTITP
jgi:hypothetical protein